MQLLATDSPQYLRRLARLVDETAWKHGAYCEGVKLQGATFKRDTNVNSETYGQDRLFLITLGGKFIPLGKLVDGYGREIVASREP